MDRNVIAQDSADAEPSLAAPENPGGSQVAWMRGNGQDREAEGPEAVLPEVTVSQPGAEVPALYKQGRQSSLVAAAAVALLDFAGVR